MCTRIQTTALLLLAVVAPTAAAAGTDGDYDGDGRSDTFWRALPIGVTGVSTGGFFGEGGFNLHPVRDLDWVAVGRGDFDGDGRTDLVWRHARSGANALWTTGLATSIAMTRVVNLDWRIVATGDFDGDGRADLFWRNSRTGKDALWRSADAATQLPAWGVTNLDWKVVGAGDFNGDGRDDLLWRNARTGASVAWRGGDALAPMAMRRIGDLAWRIQGIGDFDGDGRDDLFWRHTGTGANAIWNGARYAERESVPRVADTYWRVVEAGDYDGDGRTDLLWRKRGDEVPGQVRSDGTWAIASWQPHAPIPWILATGSQREGAFFVGPDMVIEPHQGQYRDDGPPVLGVADADNSTGAEILTFVVRLSRPAETAVRFDIATAEDPAPSCGWDYCYAAVAGVDYASTAASGVTIPAGSLGTRFAVPVYSNAGTGGTFLARLANVSGAWQGTDGHGYIYNSP